MTEAQLSPPCSGWQEDLSRPEEPPISAPSLGLATPNHQDEIFLELSRASSLGRGIVILFVPVMIIQLVASSWLFISDWRDLSVEVWMMFAFFVSIEVWSILVLLKFDVVPPRDLPLRFNRARQRMYTYNFKYRWWNPFERRQVTVVAYDWSQVRAERWKKRGATAQGALIIKWGVVLSIVKPGTNEVIDRFPLSTMGADEFAWAYICTYMQQGPEALPPPGPPRDHNDVPWYNLALRLAPKVKWPADMDRESRTAP
ncbi:DUF6708 domain-containing protein [Pseudomonas chlororaphis]|uniref:DUF6708 domain-containing protein n=1 Tax=Pseudomonas chlororaphis TaxID=587753 RepID=UPI003B96C1CF